ncbi:heat-shock protein [Alistipes sp. An116]|nr:heat-shock protein [Alistipes sp. An116]
MMKKILAAAGLLLAMTACCCQQENLPLEGTSWKLSKMESIPATAVSAEEDAFTLMFNAADTLVAGRTNCNRFFGPYILNGKSLKFGDLGMTRMACPDLQYETSFVEMLSKVNGFEIKGSDLKLLDGDRVLAEFQGTQAAAE